MPMNRWCALFGLVLLASLGGCETIDQRIVANQAYFERLDPEVQATLRAGEVRLGFSPRMIEIALGAPSEVRRRTTAAGERTVWLYQYYHPVYEGQRFIGMRYYHVGQGSARRLIGLPEYREHYRYTPREYLRIEFEEGRAVAIERTD